MSIGLLVLRLIVGLTLAAHGAQKLFGWFGGYGLEGTGQFLEQLGFRPGRRQAALAGVAEAGGGLLLASGLFTPFAAAVSVHLPKGFFAHLGGYEYTLVLGTAALAIAFTGPGPVSLDQALGIDWSGNAWGLGALVAGAIGAAVPLLARSTSQAEARHAA